MEFCVLDSDIEQLSVRAWDMKHKYYSSRWLCKATGKWLYWIQTTTSLIWLLKRRDFLPGKEHLLLHSLSDGSPRGAAAAPSSIPRMYGVISLQRVQPGTWPSLPVAMVGWYLLICWCREIVRWWIKCTLWCSSTPCTTCSTRADTTRNTEMDTQILPGIGVKQ